MLDIKSKARMLLDPYIAWPTFSGSWHVWSFDFQTCALLWKALRFSWGRRRKLFVSSEVPLNINLAFILRFLAAWVPSVSHLLNLSLSSRALPCVYESPYSYYLYCLDVSELVEKNGGEALLNLPWYGIQTGSHDFSRLLLDDAETFQFFQPSCRDIEIQSTLGCFL